MPYRYRCDEHPGWTGEVLREVADHRDREHPGLRDPLLVTPPMRGEFHPRPAVHPADPFRAPKEDPCSP